MGGIPVLLLLLPWLTVDETTEECGICSMNQAENIFLWPEPIVLVILFKIFVFELGVSLLLYLKRASLSSL